MYIKSIPSLAIAISFTLASCQSTVVDFDPEQRDSLFSRITNLEGRWAGQDPEGETQYTEFEVSSGGSVLREIMLTGTDYEMTNMYAMDGDTLTMVHYCAGGNQPFMRATGVEDGRLAFEFERVQDLKSSDELYMGEMTLVFVDDDHIEQHWRAYKDGKLDHEMTIPMTRVSE